MLSQLRPVVITVCVNYWDYLEQTLETTLRFARAVYVVTSEDESPAAWALQLERDGKIIIRRTNAFGKGVFNKSGAIMETQTYVHAKHPDEWVLLLDADIIADPDLCHDAHCKLTLYSVNRMDYETPDLLDSDRGSLYFCPGAGYFQLYFDKTKFYPEYSEDASECDMVFYNKFQRRVILGGAVKHLGRHTVNWKGRVSDVWHP